jgi:chemotaxis protein methyltransferase CheR
MTIALAKLAQLVADRIGVAIDTRRRASIESRLAPLMERRGFASLDDLVTCLLGARDPDLFDDAIDALVTCETLFFRDRAPFEALRSLILPALREARRDTHAIRIWSAACATGQEPYSIAMLLDESAREFAGWRIDLVASDVSQAALATAAAGRYTQFEVQRGLPTPLLLRHFTKDSDGWRIAEHLRATIEFRRVNLLSDFARQGRFDVVLCRNVLMYMDVERRRDVLSRIARQLAPDGYLMMGATETVVGLSDEFVAAPGHAGLFMRASAETPRLRLVANS